MSSFEDLSQISDIHSISRSSRLNSSRLMGRADSLPNLSEQLCFSYNGSKNAGHSNQETNHLQKAVKCLTSCEENIGEFVKNKLILDCLKEVSSNTKETLSEAVVTKLKGLLSIHELNKYMQLSSLSLLSTLGNVQNQSNILGITDIPKYDFNHEEILEIKYYVETVLREKIYNFLLRYESLGGNMKEVLKCANCNVRKQLFKPYEVQIFQWRNKTDELCTQYETDVTRFITLMNHWNTLKYKDTNKIYLEKAEYILLQAQVAEMQAKIVKLSCMMKMYKETPITINAHKMLNAAMEKKLFMILDEIKEKENLKNQYEKLQNTEYKEVLKTYLQLCEAIKKKKQILEKL